MTVDSRPARESEVVMSQLMMPQHANPSGDIHGGVVLQLLDQAAGVAAVRHCRMRVVTARLDQMNFLQPVYVGNLLTIKASVNAVGTTSLEVGARVEAEDLKTGDCWHVASAYLVFVALNDEHRPTRVPRLLAETPSEERRMREAAQRRAHRQRGEEEIRATRESTMS